jgi:PAS domain S-box-containing protein
MMSTRHRYSCWNLLGIGAGLMLAFWVMDSFLDGVLFGEGGFARQLLHPETQELAYRGQTVCFLIFLIWYIRRQALAQDRLTLSLEAALADLATEKNRSEAILAAMPDAVSVQDTGLKIIYQNPAHKELMGDHGGEFCYAAYQHRTSVCPGCHLISSFSDGLLHRREVTYITGQGERHGEIYSVPLKNAGGVVIAGIESVRDITDRKIVENRLHQQLAAIEASMDGIAVLNAAGEYLYLNQAHAAVYGYLAPDELLGKGWQVLYTPEERQRLEPLIYAAFDREGGWRGEATGLKKDGTTFPQEISLTLLKDGGIICVVRDISRRKKAEVEIRTLNDSLEQQALELRATNQELEAFSYSLSHDLRSPLTTIFTAAQALDEMYRATLDGTGTSLLQAIRSGCENMEELIEAMLVLFRVTRDELSRTEVDLSGLANEIMADLQLRHLDTPATWRLEPGLTALADPHLARILLENLLGNAVKYSARSSNPTIEFGQRTGAGGVEFYLRDNGVGFDMKDAEKIFLPFRRLHVSSGFPGTGIGLATVKRIIDRHGGRIRAEGAVGKGATFFFSLPAAGEGTASSAMS